tara:strand:+ start:217 stop:348 length:132 start_codon:yes stop_codon:yes gene_type:complete
LRFEVGSAKAAVKAVNPATHSPRRFIFDFLVEIFEVLVEILLL